MGRLRNAKAEAGGRMLSKRSPQRGLLLWGMPVQATAGGAVITWEPCRWVVQARHASSTALPTSRTERCLRMERNAGSPFHALLSGRWPDDQHGLHDLARAGRAAGMQQHLVVTAGQRKRLAFDGGVHQLAPRAMAMAVTGFGNACSHRAGITMPARQCGIPEHQA